MCENLVCLIGPIFYRLDYNLKLDNSMVHIFVFNQILHKRLFLILMPFKGVLGDSFLNKPRKSTST